jgi:hypothetical protein
MDLEVVDALKAAGVPDDKARAVVVSLHREIDQRYALHAAQLATRGDLTEVKLELNEVKLELKRDVAEVKLELKRDVADVRIEMARLHAESMAATARLETKLAETKAELIRWSVGSFIAMAGVFTAISRLMAH